ncbi:MAG: PAS domain-containing protein [Rhizobiales bacterium]|nr:PAS domain-containing protein [Hyphomicrobiales bacterium]
MSFPQKAGHMPHELAGKTRVTATDRLFRALVANSVDIYVIVRPDLTISFQSQTTHDILGYGAEALVDRHALDFIHPDDRDRIQRQLESAHRTMDWLFASAFRVAHKNGSWVWMESRFRNLLADPDVAGILCSLRDITHTHRLESQLQEAEELARFGHWRWVKGAPAPTWSAGVARLLNQPVENLPVTGDWYRDLIHPDDCDDLLSKFLDAFETHEPVNTVTRFLTGDGTYRYIKTHAYVELEANSEVGALVGLAEDVTVEIETERARQASEAKYRLMAEEASDVVTHYDLEGRVIFMSEAIMDVLGRMPEEFIGNRLCFDIIHPDDASLLTETTQSLLASGGVRRLDYRCRHAEGHYVWLETTLRASTDPATGRIKEIFGISRDLTERKRHEFELMEARERAEEASRTKSQFLANMSHELRTPLNAIIGFSEILRLQMFGDLGHSRYLEYAQLINESGGLLLDLISDILDMSKIEAGKFDLYLEHFSIDEAVESCLRLVRGRAEENGLTLTKTVSPDYCDFMLHADQRSIKQILLNLLSNALKFTPRGGRVELSLARAKGMLTIKVCDTGKGIPADQISRLGRPFEQIMGDSSLAKQGTGLGLALVRSLSELHGGSFTLESELGVGTCVTITLPEKQAMTEDRQEEEVMPEMQWGLSLAD